MAHQHDFVNAGELVQAGNANASSFYVGVQALDNMKKISDVVSLSNADTIWYMATGNSGDYEFGTLVYVSATTSFTRANSTVVYSTNSNNAVSFSGPVKVVFIGGLPDISTASVIDDAKIGASAITL